MKTIEINLYQYSELSKEAKEKAVELLADVNLLDEWWNSVYEDAENVGLKIAEFDLNDGRSNIGGEIVDSHFMTAEKIVAEHGKTCHTYKIAEKFLKNWTNLVSFYSDGKNRDKVAEENEEKFDPKGDELEEALLKDLCSAYLHMLNEQYEYLSSEKAIVETIEANKYDFTAINNPG